MINVKKAKKLFLWYNINLKMYNYVTCHNKHFD